MSMERGGFGNVARSASFVERVCLAARCARDRWAGAAAAAAGAGTRAAADLLTSARRTLVAMAGLFDTKKLEKDQGLLLQCAEEICISAGCRAVRGRAVRVAARRRGR